MDERIRLQILKRAAAMHRSTSDADVSWKRSGLYKHKNAVFAVIVDDEDGVTVARWNADNTLTATKGRARLRQIGLVMLLPRQPITRLSDAPPNFFKRRPKDKFVPLAPKGPASSSSDSSQPSDSVSPQ